MGKLEFKRLSQSLEGIQFDCGIKSINEYVIDSYYPTITQCAYAYSILVGEVVVGYYMVMFREIEIMDFPDEISEHVSELNDGKISAIHIRYIAIDKAYQRHGIGRGTLVSILRHAMDSANVWPIRVVTIDARTELISWYEKEGFKIMANNTQGQEGITCAMYLDCLENPEAIEEYERKWIENL